MPTTVTLQTTFVALASNLAAPVSLGVISKPYTPAVTGSVLQYAGGRFRAVSQQGLGRSLDVTFTLVDLADRTTLEGWVGQMVCYRDPQGQKVFGVYMALKITPRTWPNVADVQATLVETTFSEAV